MTVPKMLETFLDGLDASTDGRGFGAEHERARLFVEDAVRFAVVRRDALERIAQWPVNSNSEPDVMANALDNIRDLARAALVQEDNANDCHEHVWMEDVDGIECCRNCGMERGEVA